MGNTNSNKINRLVGNSARFSEAGTEILLGIVFQGITTLCCLLDFVQL
jgi:hypothetical protein